MTGENKAKAPFQPPQWLLEAAKKRSGVPSAPSKALLDSIQRARDHPNEVARKLREDALKSGRDPNVLANWMTEMSKNTLQARLAQRPKNLLTKTTTEDIGTAVESVELADQGEITEETETPSPAAVVTLTSPAPRARLAASTSRTVTPGAEWSVPTSPRVERRVGAKGQVTKPTQARKRNDQASSRDKVRRKPTKSGRTSSTSGTTSPMEIDSVQPTAESSAAGAVRETLSAASRTLADYESSTTQPVAQPYPFPTRPAMPAWYGSVSQQSQNLLDRKRPQELAAIDALKDCIRRCELEKSKDRLTKEYNAVRDHVHKAESSLNMDKVKVKKTRILTDAGLPRIFNEHAKFPWDLKADAWHLYERWMNEDFERDILRGIVTVKGKDRNGDRLDPAYRAKHLRDPRIFGDNGAVLGQWWPSQLCAVRDGIHGAAQGGIYGDKDQGAYSIVLSSGGYHDRDDGDTIEYSGTEGSNFEIKAATQSMITSAKLGNHIRVLRSSQLPKSNKHRPEVGLRYDGLYQIKSYKEIELEKQTYLFRLERVPGQEPIRSQGVTVRPTVFEKQEYDRCKGRV